MERREAVLNLVEWRGDLPDLVAAVREYPYDSEVPIVTLQAEHIRKAMERYLRGEIAAAELEAWADAVEGRDDIEYFEPHEDEISEALFRLSTPELNSPLSKEVAEKWLSELSAL
jgi:hypothetical protein